MKINLLKFFCIICVFVSLEATSDFGFFSSLKKHTLSQKELSFEIRDATEEFGININHKMWHNSLDNVLPWTTAMGAHVSVTDYDNDGWMDFFVGKSGDKGTNHLFKNLNGKGFKDVTDEVGLNDSGDDYNAHRAVFFDCDNDGDRDLFIQTLQCPRFFLNQGHTFKDHTESSNISACFAGFASNVLDYDKDGLLDIVYASYETGVPDHSIKSKKKGQVKLYRNKGACQFEDQSQALNLDHPFTIAIGVADLNGSGHSDIWFSSDYSQDRVVFGLPGGRFENVSSKVRSAFSRHGMSAEISYLGDKELPSVFVTHVIAAKVNPEGNSLWQMNSEGHYSNTARNLGVSRCGFAWGSKFLDIDNDSDLDLLVATGFISGAENSKDYSFKVARLMHTPREIMSHRANWPNMRGYSLFGNERSCLFLGEEKGFSDIAEQTVLKDHLFDGRAISSIDFENNGSVDFLMANQKGPLKAYLNEQKNENHWIGFYLQGVCSNRDAFGAKVVLHSGKRKLIKEVQPLNGTFSQSDPRIHFGLGSSGRVDKVQIFWPSGFQQTLDSNIALNSYLAVKEPGDCHHGQ